MAVVEAARLSYRHPSPLRYPGGKGKISNFMKLVFLHNHLVGREYVELYAGGASVALSLLFEEYAPHVHINDLNPSVFAFWDAVLRAPDALCRRIAAARLTVPEWLRQRAVQDAKDPDPIDLAFSTFYLNRTNRSGIINGGIIGGRAQAGNWKMDARFNKTELVRRIEKIARYATRISLTKMDAAEYLRRHLATLGTHTFIYLDPPYYEKGGALYQNSYGHTDHAEIARLIRSVPSPWIVSYDAVPQILKMYQGEARILYSLSYSAGERYRGSEAMFLGPGVKRPPAVKPANLHMSAVLRASGQKEHAA